MQRKLLRWNKTSKAKISRPWPYDEEWTGSVKQIFCFCVCEALGV